MSIEIIKNTNKQNLLQLLWLRLIAVITQFITIFFTYYYLEIALPLNSMFLVLTILILISGISFYRYKNQKNITNLSLFFELLIDVFAFGAQIYFSGGISNPFISLFLLQVIIAAILLETIYAIFVTTITIILYIALSFKFNELHEFHHHGSNDFFSLHLQGMLISYVFAAILILVFITKINKNLKLRDKKINLLKQQSLEKEQIIQMGLLATSAAHELSTPLSTISVITSDWKKMPLNNDLIEDINIIESQIDRSKNIISQILSFSGRTRLETANKIKVKKYFDDLVNEWKNSRKPEKFIYEFKSHQEKEIIADNILSQAFFNILDNALKESPNLVQMIVNVDEDKVKVIIEDFGKGFSEEILKKLGSPNISTKNSNGMGLFLAINILKQFEGKLDATNKENTGALIKISIPL